MNNVITNGKASISDWTNSNYEKKSISKERNITLYKRMKKRFLVFDIVMPFNSGFLVAAIINTIKNIANIFLNKWLFIFIFIILSFLFYSFFLYVLYFLLSLHTK
ncbi:MAG: hypothetical protein U0K52_06475, partial [Clostridia bacterium]|nr:hypothetical protein [Clostridia bacterium]